jgi:hypothetical protein
MPVRGSAVSPPTDSMDKGEQYVSDKLRTMTKQQTSPSPIYPD